MPTVNYLDDLRLRFKDLDFAAGVLNALLDDYDEAVFLDALKQVAIAQGGIAKLAAQTDLNREHLFRMLSKKGNPTFYTLQKIAKAFGWKIIFSPKKNKKKIKNGRIQLRKAA